MLENFFLGALDYAVSNLEIYPETRLKIWRLSNSKECLGICDTFRHDLIWNVRKMYCIRVRSWQLAPVRVQPRVQRPQKVNPRVFRTRS